MEPHLYCGQAILTNQIVKKQKEWVIHPVAMVYIPLPSYISLSLRYSYSYFALLKKCFGWLARLAFCTMKTTSFDRKIYQIHSWYLCLLTQITCHIYSLEKSTVLRHRSAQQTPSNYQTVIPCIPWQELGK